MERVEVTRLVEEPPESVEAAMADLESFMRAAGFDEVRVEGEDVHIENVVGLATMTLDVEVVDSDAALEYVQRDGIFAEMRTRYEVEPADGASEVTAVTEFTLGKGIVGQALDATLVSRQRRSELTSQLAALPELVAEAADGAGEDGVGDDDASAEGDAEDGAGEDSAGEES